MKKILIALAVVLVLCVPAFATDYSAYFVTGYTCSDGSNWNNFTVSTSDNVYFARVNMESSSPSSTRVYAFSDSSSAQFVQSGYRSGDSLNRTLTTSSSAGNGVYYSAFSGSSSIPSSCNYTPDFTPFPYGTTESQMATAFSEFLSSSGDDDSVASSFTVPCGNVLYFQVSSEQDLTLSAQMPQLSYLVQFGNNAYGPWGDTGIEYGPAAALPTAGTTFPILSMDPIQWGKGEPKNILGQSRIGVATKHCIVGQWYALFCPLTSPQVLDASTGDHAMGASVVVSGSFSQIKVYPLSETLDYDNPLGATYESGSNDDYDSYFDGSSDENGTVTWTNQDGQVQAPQSGGTNYVSPAANAESLLSQIRQLLANIVSELKSLFTFGYEAVQDLVGIMRDFVNVLGGLYTWLPAEVYSALMSAVVVAIVIGVFKVFL